MGRDARVGGGAGVPDHGWDERQASRQSHLLQSRAWASFQAALGRELAHEEAAGWSWVGPVVRERGYSYVYIPYGPTARDGVALAAALKSVGERARALGVDFIRCEPFGVGTEELQKTGLHAVRASQPARTLVADLALNEAELRRHMASGHRNSINRAYRSGLELLVSNEQTLMAPCVECIMAASKARGFRDHDRPYYETMLRTLMPSGFAKLALARLDSVLLSAAIIFDHEGTRAYAHAGNTPEAKMIYSSHALVWYLITNAKAAGMTRFDFWGVAPTGAPKSDPWAGFSTFKRAFGGQDVEYAGTWDLPVKPVKYAALSLARDAVLGARSIRGWSR